METKVLEEYNFINTHTEKSEENFRNWVTTHTPSLTEEIPHPKKLDYYLDEIYQGLNLFGENLGHSFTKRLPKYHQIHLIPKENLLSGGATQPDFKDISIKWRPSRSVFNTLKLIQHEIVHQISSKNIYINPKTGNFIAAFGFNMPPYLENKMLTEGFTEMINDHLIENYWKLYPDLNSIIIKNRTLAYSQVISEIKKNILKISEKNQVEYDEIFIELTKGFFESNSDFIHKYKDSHLFTEKY